MATQHHRAVAGGGALHSHGATPDVASKDAHASADGGGLSSGGRRRERQLPRAVEAQRVVGAARVGHGHLQYVGAKPEAAFLGGGAEDPAQRLEAARPPDVKRAIVEHRVRQRVVRRVEELERGLRVAGREVEPQLKDCVARRPSGAVAEPRAGRRLVPRAARCGRRSRPRSEPPVGLRLRPWSVARRQADGERLRRRRRGRHEPEPQVPRATAQREGRGERRGRPGGLCAELVAAGLKDASRLERGRHLLLVQAQRVVQRDAAAREHRRISRPTRQRPRRELTHPIGGEQPQRGGAALFASLRRPVCVGGAHHKAEVAGEGQGPRPVAFGEARLVVRRPHLHLWRSWRRRLEAQLHRLWRGVHREPDRERLPLLRARRLDHELLAHGEAHVQHRGL
mmetsp:Transcript_48066/g.159316  ORF Transcript_48066/g.159316 Transcript_48066/m.159316 type:complete len:397 (-) Transcript_48066:5406-6596(-)